MAISADCRYEPGGASLACISNPVPVNDCDCDMLIALAICMLYVIVVCCIAALIAVVADSAPIGAARRLRRTAANALCDQPYCGVELLPCMRN